MNTDIRAVIMDLDGTTIPNALEGKPSVLVTVTVRQAIQKGFFVSVATGRPAPLCKDIIETLGINKACVVNGGTQVYDFFQEEVRWRVAMDDETVSVLLGSLRQFPYTVVTERDLKPILLNAYAPPKKLEKICILAIKPEDKDTMLSVIARQEGLIAHSVHSWTKGMFDIHICNELATKRHALEVLLAQEGISPHTVMAVGDGGNDLPLFEIAGWKVAMGNATEELKAKADFIAPDVDQDGLAFVIKRFLLKEL